MRTNTKLLLGALAAAVGLYLYTRTQGGSDVLAEATDYVGNLVSGGRGIRNNNPGNIRRNPANNWQGQLTADEVAAAGMTWDPVFVQFDTPANGVRAIGHTLMSYAARGLVSVAQIIPTYSATDQEAYVANVSAALGVTPDEVIDVQSSLPQLAEAIIQQEEGQQPYDPNDITAWVYS